MQSASFIYKPMLPATLMLTIVCSVSQYRFNVYVISIFYATIVYNADSIVYIQVYVASTPNANTRMQCESVPIECLCT